MNILYKQELKRGYHCAADYNVLIKYKFYKFFTNLTKTIMIETIYYKRQRLMAEPVVRLTSRIPIGINKWNHENENFNLLLVSVPEPVL